jgi:hypothetical protein
MAEPEIVRAADGLLRMQSVHTADPIPNVPILMPCRSLRLLGGVQAGAQGPSWSKEQGQTRDDQHLGEPTNHNGTSRLPIDRTERAEMDLQPPEDIDSLAEQKAMEEIAPHPDQRWPR